MGGPLEITGENVLRQMTKRIGAQERRVTRTTIIGEVRFLAHATAPNGWVPADGRTLERDVYPQLFDVLGDRFGAPSASTFKIPTVAAPAGLISVIKF